MSYYFPFAVAINIGYFMGSAHTHKLLKQNINNQGHYPDIGSGTSSVFSFCARFSDVILQGTSGGYRLSDCKPDGYGIFFFTNIN